MTVQEYNLSLDNGLFVLTISYHRLFRCDYFVEQQCGNLSHDDFTQSRQCQNHHEQGVRTPQLAKYS